MDGDPGSSRLVARRADVMAVLDAGPQSKRDLAEDLDVSRSTVDRAVRELEMAELVVRTDDGLRLTPAGTLALNSVRNHHAELAGIERARDLLDALPCDVNLPAALFRDARITTPNRTAPDQLSEPLVDILAEARNLRHFATGVRPEYSDQYWHRRTDEQQTDIVATEGVVGRALDDPLPGMVDALAANNYRIWETPETRPYSFLVGDDDVVCVLVYDDHTLLGIVTSEAPGAVDWARTEFAALRETATCLTDPPG